MIIALLIWLIPSIVFYIIVRLQHTGLYWTLETRWDTIAWSLAWPFVLLALILLWIWEYAVKPFTKNVNWNKDVKWILVIGLIGMVGCGKKKYEKLCDAKLPYQHYLVQDSLTKKYAIKFMHMDEYTYFVQRYEIDGRFICYRGMATASEADTFKDSCEAKGFAIEALDWIAKENANNFIEPQPEVNRFK
jgi:hypothetical protein